MIWKSIITWLSLLIGIVFVHSTTSTINNHSNVLCGITVLFNPVDYNSRKNNFDIFKSWISNQNLHLVVVQLAYSENNIVQIKDDEYTKHVLIKIKENKEEAILWQKEALINIGIQNIPWNWCENVAWIDADVMLQDGWIEETNKMLKQNQIGQAFTHLIKLPPGVYNPLPYFSSVRLKHLPIGLNEGQIYPSCCFVNSNLGCYSGFVWAAKRNFLVEIFGLYPFAIVGGFDSLLVNSFFEDVSQSCDAVRQNEEMFNHYEEWWSIVRKANNGKLACPSRKIIATHLYHGNRQDRTYLKRHSILLNNSFNPKSDVKYSSSKVN